MLVFYLLKMPITPIVIILSCVFVMLMGKFCLKGVIRTVKTFDT